MGSDLSSHAPDAAAPVEPPPMQPVLLDAGEVARLLSCSTRTVRRLADSGRIPRPVRLGALVRWPRAVLEQWIDAGCQPCERRARR